MRSSHAPAPGPVPHRPAARGQPLVRVEQDAQVLARLERPDEQHVAAGGHVRAVPQRRPRPRARRAHVHAVGVHAEPFDDLPAGVLRHGHDGVGAPSVRRRQRGVVAPDLGGGALGMRQEEEIVHRHHAGGARGRNQERMRRVDHVGLAREPFHRRPFGAVPEQVQDRHGHAAIDDAGVQRFGRARCRAVGPRTGEHRHVVGGVRGGVGSHELVHVFTDPGAGTERRAVVHEDPHLQPV